MQWTNMIRRLHYRTADNNSNSAGKCIIPIDSLRAITQLVTRH